MAIEPANAQIASLTCGIDLADDALAGVRSLQRDAYELVARHAAESHVAAQDFEVGRADARGRDRDARFAVGRLRLARRAVKRGSAAVHPYRQHRAAAAPDN